RTGPHPRGGPHPRHVPHDGERLRRRLRGDDPGEGGEGRLRLSRQTKSPGCPGLFVSCDVDRNQCDSTTRDSATAPFAPPTVRRATYTPRSALPAEDNPFQDTSR